MGCGASSAAGDVTGAVNGNDQSNGIGSATMSLLPAGLGKRRGSASNATVTGVQRGEAMPSKIVRLVLCRPFSRTEPLAQLLHRCAFPILREQCARRGWRLIIIDPTSEADPSQDPRPDTLAVLRRELETCIKVSGGPALLSILDHTRGLPTALPPGQIPEAEFATLRDWMRGEQCLAAISHRRLGRQAGLQEGEVSRLLDKWYRQVQVSLTGDKRGPFCLEVPPELRDSSMFTGRESLRVRRALEMSLLGEVLSMAAPKAMGGKTGLQVLKRNKKLAKRNVSLSRPPPGTLECAVPLAGESAAGLAQGGGLDPLGKLWEETEKTEGGGKFYETRTMREEAAEASPASKQQVLAPGRKMRNGRYSSTGSKTVLPGEHGDSGGEDEDGDGEDGEASGSPPTGGEADSLNDGQGIAYGSKYPADILRKYEASAPEMAFDMVREIAGAEEGWRSGLVSVIHSSVGISGAPPRMADGHGLKSLFEVDAVKWKRVRKMKQAARLGQEGKAVDAKLGIEPRKVQNSGFPWGASRREGKVENRLPRQVRKELERLGNIEQQGAEEGDHDGDDDEGVGVSAGEECETVRDVLVDDWVGAGREGEDKVFDGDLSLVISRIEIEGLSGAAGIYCEVTLTLPTGGSEFGGDRLVASTVRRKPGRDGRFVWQSLTGTPASTRLVQDGLVAVKLMESRMVGADKCLGDFAVMIKDLAHHEDDEERERKDGDAGAWHKVFGPTARKVGDEEEREVVGSGMLEMTVRSPGSGRELMRSAKAMINEREFSSAIENLREAIRRFIERGNGRAAAEAKTLIDEVEMRRAMSEPSTLRRLAWLRSDMMGEKQERIAAAGGKAASSVAHFFRASSNRVLAYSKGIGQRQERELVQKPERDKGVVLSSVDMPGQDGGPYEDALRALESEMSRRGLDQGWEALMMRAIDTFPDQARVTLRGVTSSMLKSLQEGFNRVAAGSEPLDPLVCEIIAHNRVKEWHRFRFLGRAKLVDGLSFYACNNHSIPAPVEFVESAESGAGLTALIASVCHEAEEKIRHKLIYRACGATSVSCDMESLVHSIALQLECEQGLERGDDELEASRARLHEQPASYFIQRRRASEIPFEYAGICRFLRLALSKGTARHPIVVIIDALDLVRGNDVADTTTPTSTEGADFEPVATGLPPLPRILQWLPLRPSPDGGPCVLPPFCRIIIGYSGQDKFTRTLVKPLVGGKAKSNLAILGGISCDGDAPARMLDRLNATGADMGWAKLTSQQMYDLLPPKMSPQTVAERSALSSPSKNAEVPRANPLAMYLSFRIAVLAAERGKDANVLIGRDKKGDEILEHGHVTSSKAGDNPQDLASTFMQTICSRHPGWGHRCLALLCCCQIGLTEDELLDLLSGAADLRQAPGGGSGGILGGDHSAADWAFQPANYPQLDALRLISDLDPVLHRIPADATEVIAFSHSAFGRAASEIACGTAEARRRSCLVLAAYFSGRDAAQTWLGGREEEAGTQAAMHVLLQGPGFPPQPLVRESVDGHRCLNLRSMRERVRALIGAGLYEAACEAVTDLGYCMAKAESGTLHLLIDEFDYLVSSRVAAPGQPKFLGLDGEFRAFIAAHRGTISRNPAMIFQLAANCRDGAAARSAHRHFDEGRGHPPWLKWRNPDSDETVASRWALAVHPGGVTAVASSSAGEVMGTAGNDRLACLWEVRSGRVLCQLPRLMQRVSCMALSDNLSHVAIGDGDGQLKMWALGSLGSSVARGTGSSDNGRLPRLHETPEFGVSAHAGPVRSIAFLSTPDLAVSCGDDGVLKVWMVSTCSVLKVLGSHEKPDGSDRGGAATCVCVLKQQQLLQTVPSVEGAAGHQRRSGGAGQERIFSSGEDRSVREWNVASGPVRVYDGHRSHVTCVAACSAGDILAAGGEDMTVRVWSLSSGKRIATVQHDAAIRFVTIDGSSATLASVCDEGVMRLWDSRSMSRIGQVDVGTHGGVRSSGSKPGSRLVCALEPRDGLIAVGGPTGTLKSWEIRPPAFKAHSSEMGGVRCVAVSNSSMATLGGGRGVAVWDLRTGSRKRELGGYQTCVNWLDMDPSRHWLLATASSSGDVMLWDTRGGDSRQPAAPIHTIFAHVRGVKAVSFSPDGAVLATCGSDGLARVYGVREHGGDDRLPSAVHGEHPPPPHTSGDATIQVWLIHNLVGHMEGIVACCFSPDSSGLITVSDDGTMRLWNVKAGDCSQIFTVTGGGIAAASGSMTSVVWAPHMRSVISGGSDGVVRVWDVGRGKEVMTLRAQRVLQLSSGFTQEMVGLGKAWSWSEVDGHRGSILCVAVSPDGAIIISGGQDGCVKAWATQGGRLVRTLLRCSSWVQSLAVTADGTRVYAACGDGLVRALRMPADGALPKETLGGGRETARSGLKLSPIKGKRKGGGVATARSELTGGEGEEEEEEEMQASVDDGRSFEFGRAVDKLALCARGALLASVAEKQNVIEVRDTAKLSSGIRKHRLGGHTDAVTDIATGEETPWVVSSSMDGVVKVWDASTGMCKHSQPCFRQGANCVTLFHPREIAAVGSVIGDVQLVDLSAGGGQISKFEGPEGAVVSLQFAGDGHLLMYAHEDGFVGVRDLRGNAPGDNRLIDANRGGKAGGLGGGLHALTKIIRGKNEAFKPTRGGCCSSDGRMLFRAYGKSIEAWDMRMMRRVHVDSAHAGTVRGLRALDQGRWIASGGSDCTVRIWSVPSGSDRVEAPEQWLDTRSAAVQAGWYGNRDVVPRRGPGQLSFSARQEVRCIAGFSVDSIFAGDASGRIYSLALEPGLEPF